MLKILIDGVEIESEKFDPENLSNRVISIDRFHEEIYKLSDMILELKKKESEQDEIISG